MGWFFTTDVLRRHRDILLKDILCPECPVKIFVNKANSFLSHSQLKTLNLKLEKVILSSHQTAWMILFPIESSDVTLQKHCRKNLCATLVFCHFHSSHRCTIKAFFSSEITSKRRPYPKMKGFCHSLFLQLDCYSCQETLPETILGSL